MKGNKNLLFLIWSSFMIWSLLFTDLIFSAWTVTGGSNSMTGESLSQAGSSVAMTPDGKVVVVGEPSFNASSGRVRIYNLINGIYIEIGNTDAMYGNAGDQAGQSVAISADGKIVAVGEPGWNSNSGRVRTYNVSGTTWVETGGALSMIGSSANQFVGYSVAMSSDGKTVIVGAPNLNNSIVAGFATVYNLTEGIWTGIGNFTGEVTFNDDKFGISVAISFDGKTIAIGAPDTFNSAGRVFAYNFSGLDWTQLGNLSDMDGQNEGDQAGAAVAINGDGTRVAVGEPGWNVNRGRGRVYSLSGSSWVLIGAPSDMVGASLSEGAAGSAIAIGSDGNIVALGEPFWGDQDDQSGRVQVYTLLGKNWSLVGESTDIIGQNDQDNVGSAVAISSNGRIVAVGEPGWLGGSDNGRVRVYVFVNSFNPNHLLGKIMYSNVASPTTPGARSNFLPGQGTPFSRSLTGYIIAKGR